MSNPSSKCLTEPSVAALYAQAEKGDPEARFQLGRKCFDREAFTASKSSEAFKWFTKAAQQGHPKANLRLRFFDRDEEQKRADALFWLADDYWVSEMTEDDAKEAVKSLRLAAELGHPKAQCYLAKAYWEGSLLEANTAEALKWFRLAAEN